MALPDLNTYQDPEAVTPPDACPDCGARAGHETWCPPNLSESARRELDYLRGPDGTHCPVDYCGVPKPHHVQGCWLAPEPARFWENTL